MRIVIDAMGGDAAPEVPIAGALARPRGARGRGDRPDRRRARDWRSACATGAIRARGSLLQARARADRRWPEGPPRCAASATLARRACAAPQGRQARRHLQRGQHGRGGGDSAARPRPPPGVRARRWLPSCPTSARRHRGARRRRERRVQGVVPRAVRPHGHRCTRATSSARENPRVGLLSIGEEETGQQLVLEAAAGRARATSTSSATSRDETCSRGRATSW